jgi:hypothetical protein
LEQEKRQERLPLRLLLMVALEQRFEFEQEQLELEWQGGHCAPWQHCMH